MLGKYRNDCHNGAVNIHALAHVTSSKRRQHIRLAHDKHTYIVLIANDICVPDSVSRFFTAIGVDPTSMVVKL